MKRRQMRHDRALLLVALIALAGAARPAHAQQPPPPVSAADDPSADLPAQAAARKKAGDQAMEALQYADALAAYSDAFSITKDPALLYNMGRALQALNRFPEALDKLEAFDAKASAELKAKVPRLPKLIAELKARVSTLIVHTNVEGARVLVRSTVVGKAPLAAPLRLASGPAEVEIEADGYFPAKKSVKLEGGAELRVDLDLFSKASTGVLAVKASSPNAEVLVDGRRIGVAPVELNVPKGTHRITVRHNDYRLYETSAVVDPGSTRTVNVTLQSKSVVTRWWFWTGVGAVALAGAAVTIVAVSERAPDTGTIAPGQLSTASFSGGPALFKF
ncbi:MAG: PEGA domain-containing protein [Minicystis sp.]